MDDLHVYSTDGCNYVNASSGYLCSDLGHGFELINSNGLALNWTLLLNEGAHNSTSQLMVSYESVTDRKIRSYTINGKGIDNTIMINQRPTSSDNILIYANGTENIETQVHIKISNLTYFPYYGMDQYLIYGYYIYDVEISDIKIDEKNTDSSSYNHIFRIESENTYGNFDAQNIAIINMQYTFGYIFFLIYLDNVTIKDVSITPDTSGSEGDRMQFLYNLDVVNEVTVENIY